MAFRWIVATDRIGSFHLMKTMTSGMRARMDGRISTVASVAGKSGHPHVPAYCRQNRDARPGQGV
jgi:NAD(P)-dependent dehydrogenase (short-subunit alcohol dehydrogenase family)